jgi:hypothetical protein
VSQIILAEKLGKALIAAKILPPNCTRFILDCEVGKPPMLYFTCLGDESLLEALPPIIVGAMDLGVDDAC